MECHPRGVYRPRNAQETPLYHLVEGHFDELGRVWDERYEREHGFIDLYPSYPEKDKKLWSPEDDDPIGQRKSAEL